jgi:hypothetical protein
LKSAGPQRLNFNTEQRMDAMALSVMMANHHKIKVSEEINKALDDIGVILLGQIKRELNLTTAEMNDALFSFSDSVKTAVNNRLMEVLSVPRTS